MLNKLFVIILSMMEINSLIRISNIKDSRCSLDIVWGAAGNEIYITNLSHLISHCERGTVQEVWTIHTLREADGDDDVDDDESEQVFGHHPVDHDHERSNKLESP